MGEVVLSSEDMEVKGWNEIEKENTETESGTTMKMKKDGCGSSGVVVRWEKFLPRRMMRVLLVEADDSTRQIISALLRKCSYRVAAVPDGLKAWELLKGRPNNVDLILTEVDLPSISGFALLTLIMEHEVCKNIPVIMMSSQDSISTVYKCMMRGAADYLVKPIRRNELSNLWQHSAVNGPKGDSVAQEKVEATSENDAASNHSNGYVACVQRNDENIDKGSDAQSSCTKPEMEAESVHMENMQELSQAVQGKSFLDDFRVQKDEPNINLSRKLLVHGSETGGLMATTYGDTGAEMTPTKGFNPESLRDSNMSSAAGDNNDVSVNCSRNVIDLIGAFDNHPPHNYKIASSNVTGKFDCDPQLDLSLRRSRSSSLENGEKKQTLGHSNSSAFTRYTNRPVQLLNPTSASTYDQGKECATTSENHRLNVGTGYSYNSDTVAPTLSTPKSVITRATGQSNNSEIASLCPQQRVYPVPVPVKGVRFSNLRTGYGSVLPPVFCSQSGQSSMLSPGSTARQESSFLINSFYQKNREINKSEQVYDSHCQNTNIATDQNMHRQEHKLDSLEDRGHISPTTDQSATSSFCNGNASHLNSMGYGSACGSNSNVDQVSIIRTASDAKNDECFLTQNGNSHRSTQREAALTKFRLKRKDRCYDKKVRYESRKKLAEQRPRVKGQFVRQVQNENPLAETDVNFYDG
ncbi:hypothetical protein FEM48_Zijuj03G0187400 [Ziziphus jujuba var. spinosa]|uniref:Two-component response regulator-like APRR5 n=1 Tax=Ziziphus jujuba var. spinosa TaxID=714518 RepID=A0A978VRZ8_ZIZJJ|nr:hypothetical protein FEM48_Zijuj03G0187400 [Ziziphus jujuba var. spinosa]